MNDLIDQAEQRLLRPGGLSTDDLDRVARGLHPKTAQPHLGGGDEDPPQPSAVVVSPGRGTLESEGERSFELHELIDELLTREREIDETTPFDALATQDISLLNELNERYDDRCAFGDVVVNCFVGATSDEDCRVLADEAVAFVSTRGRVVEARCDFTCEIE